MSMTGASQPEILFQIERAHRAARRSYRGRFLAVWIVLVGALVAVLYINGNIDPEWIRRNAPFILGGIPITILVSVGSIVLATVLALIGAVGRLSPSAVLSGAATLYVSLFRGTPLLVQIFFIYFALPEVGVVLPALPSGILALGLNYGAYMTEIFRAGIQAVPDGQREAARALGMPEPLVFRRIVVPQASRIVTPAIGNEFIAMIKDSALISTISVQELLWRAERAGTRDARTLQALLLAALVYWLLTIVFSFFQDRLERRFARGDR